MSVNECAIACIRFIVCIWLSNVSTNDNTLHSLISWNHPQLKLENWTRLSVWKYGWSMSVAAYVCVYRRWYIISDVLVLFACSILFYMGVCVCIKSPWVSVKLCQSEISFINDDVMPIKPLVIVSYEINFIHDQRSNDYQAAFYDHYSLYVLTSFPHYWWAAYLWSLID